MIKKFDDFTGENLSEAIQIKVKDIDAREDIEKRESSDYLAVNTEIDPGHEVHPTISVYFPQLFMYIDLEKIASQDYEKISTKTMIAMGNIVSDLDDELDEELHRCIKTMQEKVKRAADKIQSITEVTSKRYGL